MSWVEKSEYLQQVSGLAERAELKSVGLEVLEGAFDEREAWRTAFEAMHGRKVRGKVVLVIP